MRIEVRDISQQTPLQPASATIIVTVEVFDPAPDLLEVYATRSMDAKPETMKRIRVQSTQTMYTIQLELWAPVHYILGVCPRTVTGTTLDEKIEGQVWTNFCIFIPYVTRAAESKPPATPARPKPEFLGLSAHQATLTETNRILLRWRCARSYEWHFVRVRRIDVADTESQIELNFNQKHGLFAYTTVPGARYAFKVAGCDENSITKKTNCSEFTDPFEIQAASNTRSLRAFLAGADARKGLRGLLKSRPQTSPVRSLRALML